MATPTQMPADKPVKKDTVKLGDARVHLGPGVLIVKTKGGELQAQPGDVIVSVDGESGILTEKVFESLGGSYADVVKKSWVARAIARRRDDGLPELTPGELTEVEEQAAKSFADGQAYQKSKTERAKAAQANPIVLATSKNAPPTANPLEQGTILGHPDLPVLDGSELEGAHAVATLEPATVVLGSPNFDIHVKGAGFKEDSVIVFNGFDEPTTFVSANEVKTGVNMGVWAAPAVVPVAVRTDGVVSNSQNFEFTAAAGTMSAQKTPPPPAKR